jgi:hypothetical protein
LAIANVPIGQIRIYHMHKKFHINCATNHKGQTNNCDFYCTTVIAIGTNDDVNGGAKVNCFCADQWYVTAVHLKCH